jgi:UDP-sugar transporter A1/2/3
MSKSNIGFMNLDQSLHVYVYSGFACIYFEKVLKGSTVSIWVRNVQMGSVGAIAAILTNCATDGAAISRDGFFQDWDALVAGVAAQVDLGGLLTDLCVRHATTF